MKKAWIIILCVAGGLLLLGGVVFAAVSLYNRLRFQSDELVSCTVSTGGGMLGGSRQVRLKRSEDGSAVLEVREKETHADRERITVYPADPALFDTLRTLVTQHNLYGASKRHYSAMRVLDGDTTSLSFDFSKDYFSISEEQRMSLSMRAGFIEAIRLLNAAAAGEGITTLEQQRAVLYLKSGYTLQFEVEPAFDGRLDDILSVEHEVSAYRDCGIVLCAGEALDCTGAEPVRSAAACDLIYDPDGERIVLLYADCTFDHDVYVLTLLDGYAPSASPLIAEMEGAYRLYLN